MRNSLRFGAPAAALLLASSYGCSANTAPTQESDAVRLDSSSSYEAQSQQIQRALNAGKQVTGITVALGYEIPVDDGSEMDNSNVVGDYCIAFVHSPIKIGKNTYAYIEDGKTEHVSVRIVKYTGLLNKAGPVDAKYDTPNPREETTTISPVYSISAMEDSADQRYYVASMNQLPGKNLNDSTISVGRPVFSMCEPSESA